MKGSTPDWSFFCTAVASTSLYCCLLYANFRATSLRPDPVSLFASRVMCNLVYNNKRRQRQPAMEIVCNVRKRLIERHRERAEQKEKMKLRHLKLGGSRFAAQPSRHKYTLILHAGSDRLPQIDTHTHIDEHTNTYILNANTHFRTKRNCRQTSICLHVKTHQTHFSNMHTVNMPMHQHAHDKRAHGLIKHAHMYKSHTLTLPYMLTQRRQRTCSERLHKQIMTVCVTDDVTEGRDIF